MKPAEAQHEIEKQITGAIDVVKNNHELTDLQLDFVRSSLNNASRVLLPFQDKMDSDVRDRIIFLIKEINDMVYSMKKTTE